MQNTHLGSSGIEVGIIAYGCWRFANDNVDAAADKISAALDAGMTLIDTADIYGYRLSDQGGFGDAETILGGLIRNAPDLRKRMVLATKGGIAPPYPFDSSYDYLNTALDASLTRLCVDYVDLYQIHRPDIVAPVKETARALNEMIRSGRVRAVGVSNFSTSQIRALQAHLDSPLASVQPEFAALCQTPLVDGVLKPAPHVWRGHH